MADLDEFDRLNIEIGCMAGVALYIGREVDLIITTGVFRQLRANAIPDLIREPS